MKKFSLWAAAAAFVLTFIGGVDTATAQRVDSAKLKRIEQISRQAFKNRLAKRGISNADELVVKDVLVDEVNNSHVKFRQTLKNIPVWGGESIVHLKSNEAIAAITDSFLANVLVSTEPNFSASDAIGMALGIERRSLSLTADPTADLWIFRGADRDHLAYRVQMQILDGTADTSMPVVFIDAQTGEKLYEYDNLQTASGTSLYSGTVTITTSKVGSTFYMEDLTKKIGTFDNRNSTASTYRFTDTNDIWNSTTQKAGVDAHYGAAKVYDYFKNVHGRNGIDGAGGPGYYTAAASSATKLISSKVHYGSNYNNAFWNGSFMTYGDGDGTTFSPLVTMDICGHEMVHGITERTAGLVYQNESGALNEAVSDIFGAMVERYVDGATNSNTWKIGEDAYTPATAGDALRYMNDTHRGGDPDHYSERYTGTADNGGVHTNSGIPNYAFFLLADGGTHHLGGSMTGIGADKAALIWYKALTTYMTSSTNFAGARTATLNAAASIYGSTSTEYSRVAQSWSLVGVN